MQFRYEIKFNDEKLTGVSIGASVKEKFEEPLDEAGLYFPLSTKGIDYEMLGTFEITIWDENNKSETFKMLSISDDVRLVSKIDDKYEHNLRLSEYSFKLEQYWLDALINTKPIISNTPARFIKTEIINRPTDTDNTNLAWESRYRTRAHIPVIDFKENYYANEDVKFEKVDRLKYYDDLGGVGTQIDPSQFTYYDLYIQIDDGAKHIITDSDYIVNLPQGDYQIKYGVVGNGNPGTGNITDDILMYTFFVSFRERVNFTLLEVVNKLRNIKPFETRMYHSSSRIFNLDSELETLLGKIEAPQFFLKKMTVFQYLSNVFTYINSIARLKHNGFGGIDILTRDDFNFIDGTFDRKKKAISFESSQTVELATTRSISPLERVLPNNLAEPNFKTAGTGLYKTIRSTGVQLTDSGFALPIERPVYQITKFEVLIPKVSFRFFASTQEISEQENVVIDITSRLINKREWDLKANNVNFPDMIPPYNIMSNNVATRDLKISNLYWTQNSKEIIFSDVFGELFKSNLIRRVVIEAVNEYYSYLGNVFELPSDDIQASDELVARYEGLQDWGEPFEKLSRIIDLKFNLEYISLENYNIVHDREDNSIIHRYSESSIKQSERLLNVEMAGRKSYGEINRGGLPNYNFKRLHYNLDGLYKWGNQDKDGYVITERQLELHNNFLMVGYTATKDHNRLQEFIGISQEYRPFDIPTSDQVYERIDSYVEYIYIMGKNVSFSPTRTILTERLYEGLVSFLQNKSPDVKATYALVRTDGMDEKDFVLTPISVHGNKNSLVFSVGFDDNQVVGFALEKIDENFYNTPIRYTDNNGRFVEFWFSLFDNNIYDVWGENDDGLVYEYPLMSVFKENWDNPTKMNELLLEMLDHSLANNGNPFSDNGVGTHLGYNPFIVHKDSAENYRLNLNVIFKSHTYGQFVFGQRFSSNNPIVSWNNIQPLEQDEMIWVRDFTPATRVITIEDDSIDYCFSIEEAINYLELNYSNLPLGEVVKLNQYWWNADNNSYEICDQINYNFKRVSIRELYLYRYKSEKVNYGIYDDLLVKDGYSDRVLLSETNVLYNILPNHQGIEVDLDQNIVDATTLNWAIGDRNGNLYLACNDNTREFKLVATHHNPFVKEIGKDVYFIDVVITGMKGGYVSQAIVGSVLGSKIGLSTDMYDVIGSQHDVLLTMSADLISSVLSGREYGASLNLSNITENYPSYPFDLEIGVKGGLDSKVLLGVELGANINLNNNLYIPPTINYNINISIKGDLTSQVVLGNTLGATTNLAVINELDDNITNSPTIEIRYTGVFSSMEFRFRNNDTEPATITYSTGSTPTEPSISIGIIQPNAWSDWISGSCQDGLCQLYITAKAKATNKIDSVVVSRYAN